MKVNGFISKITLFFLLILRNIQRTQQACSEISVTGVQYQVSRAGLYQLENGVHCHNKVVYAKRHPGNITHYLHFANESTINAHWKGWMIGPYPCQNYGGIAATDPTAVTPDAVTVSWEEAVNRQWVINPWLNVRCSGYLEPWAIFLIVISSIIGLVICCGCTYYCYKAYKDHKEERRTGNNTRLGQTNLANHIHDVPDFPPPDIVMSAPPYLALPPSYEEAMGAGTVPVYPNPLYNENIHDTAVPMATVTTTTDTTAINGAELKHNTSNQNENTNTRSGTDSHNIDMSRYGLLYEGYSNLAFTGDNVSTVTNQLSLATASQSANTVTDQTGNNTSTGAP